MKLSFFKDGWLLIALAVAASQCFIIVIHVPTALKKNQLIQLN